MQSFSVSYDLELGYCTECRHRHIAVFARKEEIQHRKWWYSECVVNCLNNYLFAFIKYVGALQYLETRKLDSIALHSLHWCSRCVMLCYAQCHFTYLSNSILVYEARPNQMVCDGVVFYLLVNICEIGAN